jgi:solute carrier family 8 (sodium/calcium exchanger)
MALGSSAPEILLSLIEITTDDMFLGELGAGTIVGSAAFNLLCISAVCVLAIEDGEVRTIDQTKVYIVTAFFSVFAYLWLMFILMVTSPDVCTIWEAVVTLLFCPLFVFLAYLADRGYFDFNSKTYEEQTDAPAIQALDLSEISHEDLKQLEHTIRENHGKHLTDEMVAEIMRLQYLPKRSRAYYRHMTTQKATNGKKAPEFSCSSSLGNGRVSDTANTFDDIDQEKKNLIAFIEFALKTYAVVENCGVAKIVVVRKGCVSVKASCNFATREGTAKAGEDYDHKEGLIVFERNEVEKTIEVPIKDDDSVEHNEWFHIDLASPHCEDGSSYEAKLGETKCATVVIIDDDEPGKIRFKEESVDIKEDNKSEKLTITVERYQGCKGEISCKWHTEEHSGKDGIDFVHQEGTITFQNDELAHTVTVTILPRSRVGDYTFFVMLKDPSDNTSFDENRDGGKDSNICTVTFKGTESKGDALTKMKDTVMTTTSLGTKSGGNSSSQPSSRWVMKRTKIRHQTSTTSCML